MDLRTSEPLNSTAFIAQMALLTISSMSAWLFLDLWETVAWVAVFAAMNVLEKTVIWHLPPKITTARFNAVRAILFVNAMIFGAMPVYLWFHPYEPLKFGALAVVTGLVLNNLNTRARYASILSCVQIPNAMIFLAIGCGIVWETGWTGGGTITAIVCTAAIVTYLLINLRLAHLKEKQAAETKAQLIQAQRSKVLGQVTGGIAHDFNNILSVINASLELLREQKGNPEQVALIDQALIATENATNLTRQMLTFGRRAPLIPEVVDVHASLQTLRNLVVRVLPATIKFSIESDPDLAAIRVDESAFHSALINLALNAKAAMPDGGTLTLRAQNREYLNGNYTKNRVEIRVTDSGWGIPNDIIDRVFDPFFTTKDVGEGSGLGLSMVKGFAEQSGGTVTLRSDAKQGTDVVLTFPAIPLPVQTPVKPSKPQAVTGLRGHILLVDDNEQMLSLLSTKLQRDGHQVSAFASGDEAVVALERGNRPDLLLSDVVMPGKTQGTHLLALMRERFPDVPVILMSGYAELGGSTRSDGPRPDAFLDKPLHLADLSAVINELLQRGPL